MKKAFCIFAAILMISALSSCGKKQEDAGTTAPAVSYASAQEVTAGESSAGTTTEKEPENSTDETVVHTDKTTAATPGTTVAYTGQKEPEKQTKREKPSIRYIRTNESDFDDSIYPKVVFIKSVSELNAYKNSNSSNYYFDSGSGSSESFNDATLKYDDDFFKDKALVMVVTRESSGSFYYDGVSVNGDEGIIAVNRFRPEVGTADMASWHIIIALDRNDPIFNYSPSQVKVLISE